MIQTAPSPVDILDFQFKLQCRLKVFQNEDITHFGRFCNILAVASKYGLLFVGSNDSLFQVIQIQSIQKYSTKDGEITDYLRRTIFLPSIPEHLSVNCDSSKLSVVIKKDGYIKAIIYDVASFLQQNISVIQEVILSSTPETSVLESVWNPAVPSVYTACKDDGSLGVYDLKGTIIEINELQNTAEATCICWSPKGKQIAVGSRDGKITQYKPDLKVAKVINGPPFEDSRFPISLQWISNYQFIAIYRTNAIDSQSSLIVINSPKVGDVTYINYEDICYSCGTARPHQFYMLLQNVWNILMVASSNSMEVGVMGFEKDIWTQWILSDSARAELPLSITKQDTLPVGLCLDTSSNQPLPWGENTLPPAPLLMILSNHGVLCCFYAVNLKEGAAQICQPPEVLSNNSTPMYFSTSSERGGPLPNKPIPINPMKQNVPLTVQPSTTTTTFSFTFNQLSKPISSISQQPSVKHENNITPVQTIFNLNLKPTITTNLTSESGTTLTSKSVTENPLKNTQEKILSLHQPLCDKKMNMVSGRTILSAMTKKPQKSETLPTFDMNEDTEALIAQMVKEECAALETELKVLLQRSQNVKIDLGTDNEATNLVQNTDTLQEFLEEINDIAQTQSAEIHYLKQTLIQTWAWYEEARSRFNTNKDPTLVTLMRVQPLDAASARQLEDIRHLLYYLESQLSQANGAIDEQWENFQDSCKKKLSLKLPSIETIYQSMVKQSATIQKQVYMLKDISNRIKMKARISTIPHLLVSLDNADKLEEQLKSLCIDSKDLFQLQYEKVFERQKHLSTNKVKELRNLLNSRHVVHVSVNKPQLLDRTTQLSGLISAPFSPIALTKKLQPTKLNFEQSTPKPTPNSKELTIFKNTELKKMSLKKEDTDDKTGVNTKTFQNSATQESVNSQTLENKNTMSITSTKPRDITVLGNSNNIFNFDENKTPPGSAFVPTTQNIFGIKNTLFGATTSNAIPTNKIVSNSDAQQKSIFSFNTPVCLVTSATKPISTSTTSVSVFSTPIPSTVADSIQKPSLFITKPPNTAVSTSKFIFGTSLASNVNTFASTTDTSSKLTFSFSNISTTKAESVSVQSTNASLVTSTLSTFKGLDTNTSISSPKFMFSSVSTAPSTSKSLTVTPTTSNTVIMLPSSTTPSALNSNSFETSPSTMLDSKSSTFSLFSPTTASTDTVKTLSSGSITQTLKTVTTPVSTIVTSTSPFSITSLSKIGTSITITPITPSITQPTSTATSNDQLVQATSPAGIDLTTVKGKHLNVTTSTAIISTIQPKVSFSSTETKLSLFNTTSSESGTTTTSSSLFSTPTPSSIFSPTPIFSEPVTGSTSMFGAPQQSTSLSFRTTQTPSSFFTTPQQTPSIFGGPQLISFGVPQKTNTSNSNSIFSGNATTASTSIFGASQTPSFGTNTLVSSHTLTTPTIQPAFSASNTTIPSLFCTNNVPSSTAQMSLFDTTATNSSASTQVFGTSNATSCTTQAPMFGSTSASSAATQTSIFGTNTVSNSASVFGAPTTQTSIFGSPNVSATSGNIFGTTTNDSIFPVIKTTSGSIFGSVPSTFSIANTSSNNFFTSSSSTSPIFGQPATFGSSSIFNTPTTTNAGNMFGNISTIPTNAFGNTSTSFGTSNTNTPFGSVFGSSTNNTSPFGFAAATGTNTPSSSGGFGFNKSPFTTFGSNSNSTDTASFSFGNLELSTTTSTAFGSGFTQNPFNRTPNQEQKSPFSGGSLFGTPAATSSSNIFGGSSPFNKNTPAFGGPATFGSTPAFGQGSAFGQNTFSSSGNIFGSSSQPGPFSGNSQSINQSGFGAPAAFGSSQAFGSNSSGGFGSPSTFGSSTFGVNSGFNTSNKLFSMPSDTFGTPSQQSSTFANLANQQTLGFGSLAQQNQTPTSQSTFSGGSSFLNWR